MLGARVRGAYRPTDLKTAAASQGLDVVAAYPSTAWTSVAMELVDGVLQDRAVNVVNSAMPSAALSDVLLVDTLFPVVTDQFVHVGMHHNADHILGYYFDAAGRPTKLFEKRSRPAGAVRRGAHFLVGGDRENFWHFLYNFVLRLTLLAQSSDADLRERAGLVVNEDLPEAFRPVFAALGFDPSRLVPVSRRSASRFEQLIVGELPFFLRGPQIHAASQATGFLRDRLPKAGRTDRRIYISRRDARWRRILNEEEIITAMVARGVEVVELSKLSVPQMIQTMAEAELVIGASGANLGALLFCRPGAKVIELCYEPFVRKYYFQVASSMGGLEHYKLTGPPEQSALPYHTWNFSIARTDLLDVLDLAGF